MEQALYHILKDNARNHWWYRGRLGILKQFVDGFIATGGNRRLLSMGCGIGSELLMLKNYGEVFGVDPSEEVVLHHKRNNEGNRVLLGSAEKIPFPDAWFDAVFAMDVIEHTPDDKIAIREAFRVLKNGGIGFFSVPAYQWLWNESDIRAHHFRRYTRKQFIELFVQAGFTIMHVTYFNTFLFLPIALVKLVSKIWESRQLVGAEVKTPNVFLNRLLFSIFSLERFFLRYIVFPFGISIFVVVRKK